MLLICDDPLPSSVRQQNNVIVVAEVSDCCIVTYSYNLVSSTDILSSLLRIASHQSNDICQVSHMHV